MTNKPMKCCPFCGARLTESVIADFVRDRCVRDARHFEPAADLYAAYRRWARDKKLEPVTPAAFGRSLGIAGFVNHRGHVVRWFGIRLKESSPSKSRRVLRTGNRRLRGRAKTGAQSSRTKKPKALKT